MNQILSVLIICMVFALAFYGLIKLIRKITITQVIKFVIFAPLVFLLLIMFLSILASM